MKKIKKQPTRPASAASTAGPCPTICKVVGRPGTGSYPAPSPDPATHTTELPSQVILIYVNANE